jgi:hypothetical protein
MQYAGMDKKEISRRSFLRLGSAGASGVMLLLLSGCAGGGSGRRKRRRRRR